MKILIVKLGAMGDVLRTTPLLTELARRYPGAQVDWVVDPQCREALTGNPNIHKTILYSSETPAVLRGERYDIAINLDKEREALDCIEAATAARKMGFGRLAGGEMGPLDKLSEYAYRLGIDDELKFRINKKTYQEISFEQAGLVFKGENYLFFVDEEDRRFAKHHLELLGVDFNDTKKPIVGLNTGSGTRFAGKRLPKETFVALSEKFSSELGARVLLLGGKDEIERNRQIAASSTAKIINTGSHPLKRFAALVELCDVVVSGDTTAMHIAIAMKTPVIAYFASTCSSEIELYGRGQKIVSQIACSPCYKRLCPIDEQCMKDMSADTLFSAAKEVLSGTPVR